MTNNQLNILLIEDNPDDQDLIQEYLLDTNLSQSTLIIAENLKDGKKILIKKSIDILILDLSLPDSFGLENLKKIRKKYNKLPIVVLTGNDDSEVAINAIKQGAQDFLSKHRFNSYLLEKTINYALERQKLIVELEQAKIKELNALLIGQEAERRRIAQDLHDGIGQQLAGMNLNISMLPKSDSTEGEIIKNLKSISKNVITEYRSVVHNLRPPSLDQGVLIAITELCTNIKNTFSISTIFDTNIKQDIINSDLGNEVYRITQELINNAIKHGKAKNINVYLYKLNNQLELTIEDNGVGFDVQKISNDKIKKGIGLKNLDSRAKVLNAHYKISSKKNKGTFIKVLIPFS